MLNIKKVRPRYNQVITTADIYTIDQVKNGLIDASKEQGSLKEYQTVVAIGPMVRDVEVGDVVMINPKRYSQYKHQEGSLKDGVITDNPVIKYNIPVIELNHQRHLLIQDNDIDFVMEEFEEEQETSIINPNNSLLID